MAPAARVLVVEDEPSLVDLLRLYLERDGFAVSSATDGDSALAAVAEQRPDLVLLDIGLPGGPDGIEVCRRLRAADDRTPVIFVTARDDEVDRVVGLELGADDYVTKPYSPRELVARVRAVLRRQPSWVAPASREDHDVDRYAAALTVGDVRLDPMSRRCQVAGRPVELTTTEFDLLAHLMRSPGRVHPRALLLEQVWGYPPDDTSRTVDVHVAQLRAKLGAASPIRTVRGVGYSVEPLR